MTITERNNKLKHYITCLKCEVSGKCCDVNCSTNMMLEIWARLLKISKPFQRY